MTWLQESEPYASMICSQLCACNERRSGRKPRAAADGSHGQTRAGSRETEPSPVMRPFSRPSLHPFQSAWLLSCQVLPRQALDKGLSRRLHPERGRQGLRSVRLFPRICSKLLISASNCWRRGSLAAHQPRGRGVLGPASLPPSSLLSSVKQ